MFADAAMSLDNVVALAAIAAGNFWLLAAGVLLSIPILAYGGLILTQIVRHAPEIMTIGAVILGWVAGEMAVSDPLLSSWIQADAPALAVLAPPLVAVFVWVAGQGAQKVERRALGSATRQATRLASELPRPPALELGREAAPSAIAPLAALLDEPPPVLCGGRARGARAPGMERGARRRSRLRRSGGGGGSHHLHRFVLRQPDMSGRPTVALAATGAPGPKRRQGRLRTAYEAQRKSD